jgi:ABC-type lipoprotein release transport system permease subunit
MKSKTFLSVLAIIAIFVTLLVFMFIKMEGMQRETCKHMIEFSMVIAINRKTINLGTTLSSNWKEFDSFQRKQLLEYAEGNLPHNTECSDYTYLFSGKDAAGTELPLFVRKDDYNNVEIRLGK